MRKITNFKIGDKVIGCNMSLQSYNKIGYISGFSSAYAAIVEFENWDRYCAERKILTLKFENIKLYYDSKKENKTMNKLTGNYEVATVIFENGYNDKKYNFALYEPFVVGDYVLVDNFSLAKIIAIKTLEESNPKPTKEVICKCDLTKYNQRIANREKAEKLKKEMDKRIAELQKEEIYKMFAEKDEVLNKLLSEYEMISD